MVKPSRPQDEPAAEGVSVTRFEHDGETLIVFSLPQDELGIVDPAMMEDPSASPWQVLTPAQLEVVRLAIAGRSNRAIARLRGTATGTVAKQLETAYRRLGINSRRELMVLAARRRLDPPPDE
jgi:DNA-binding CsgD family transcriptional regulator